MDIPKKLLKLKFLFLFAIALSLLLSAHIFIAPRFVDILAYFWPLFVSTALFLVAVVVFGRTSPPAAEPPGEKAGEGILDYVAGQPELVVQPEESSHKSDE